MTTARVDWTGGLRFVGEADSGHLVIMDARSQEGEDPGACTPVEATLIALCACSGVDVVSILRKMQAPPRAMSVSAEAKRSTEHPKVFTEIRLKFHIEGDVPEGKARRAVDLSEGTYCSIRAMLGATATITHEIEIVP